MPARTPVVLISDKISQVEEGEAEEDENGVRPSKVRTPLVGRSCSTAELTLSSRSTDRDWSLADGKSMLPTGPLRATAGVAPYRR